jgi:hypothetical protein
MPRSELTDLTARLAAILTEIDTAVRARFSDTPRRQVAGRRHAGPRHRDGLLGVAAATLWKLAGSPMAGRTPRRRA